MDDSQIVELYLKRQESAIRETADKYGAKLLRMAINLLNDRESAEECENDTYLKTWELIPPNEPRTYLFAFTGRILRHLVIDKLRYENRQKRAATYCELTDEMLECIPGEKDVSSNVDTEELTELINAFLSSLPVEQRNIFVRRYWFFDSVSDICDRYHLPQSKVKTTLFRLREKLKKQLTQGGYTL